MNFVLLCAFVLFSVVHSDVPSADEVKKYFPCWKYALCQDASSAKKIESCINILKPKELQSYFQYLKQNYFSFNSDSLSGKISEYCSYDNDKKKDVFDKIIEADYDFLTKAGDEGKEGTKSRTAKAINCIYNDLQKLQSEDKCTTA